ncbi:hypothetical protein SAMN02745121_01614 [Nannocystis exedens]|uniref:Lipoprotein n=1 Tax=Nannocystis exedens TaxID=54 RepID=A0A1I1V8B4_9BACT|nr:hypothetical protein [Nannocystis exedens]PCC72437.1 hypothetical protein NAEX_05517 [Nannocystis exedens]SFD79144.1 hypothetical protein SAMN02745121_01614 [Nannocystis exedens]
MSRAWLVGLSLLSACGPEFEPREGRWEFLSGEVLDERCGEITERLSVDFMLEMKRGGRFTIAPVDATGTIACELAGMEFECPEHLVRVTISGTDVTLDVSMTEVGSFTSETEGSGRRDARVVCRGSQCPLAAAVAKVTFPCTAALEFMVAHAE